MPRPDISRICVLCGASRADPLLCDGCRASEDDKVRRALQRRERGCVDVTNWGRVDFSVQS